MLFRFSGGSNKDAEYKLAQSGDATCNGLESAEVWIVGPETILKLNKTNFTLIIFALGRLTNYDTEKGTAGRTL